MAKAIVARPDGTQVATITRVGAETYLVSSEDDGVRLTIERLLDEAKTRGLPHGFYSREKTETGHTYQRQGRWVKPGDETFLHALCNSITSSDLTAYPVDA